MKRAPHTPTLRRAGGFSIVELMVSVAIGLLALMFATRLITGGEQDKQAALGGSDAMQNGMMAMLSITSDANQAGFGLNDPLLAGCDTTMADKGGDGYHLAPSARGGAVITPLAPVIIETGTRSDRVTFYTGGAMTGTASVRLRQAYTGGTTVAIDREPYGFRADDVIVLAPELAGTKCSLVQLSQTPVAGAANPVLRFDTGGGRRFNSGALVNNFPVRSRLFNLGPADKLALHTWSVTDGGFLQLTATDMAGSEASGSTVTDNIIAIKAQYGFDTRSAANFLPEDGINIGTWSATMVDADGNGVSGSAGDFQRIAAVRVAVVARSKTPERPKPGAACSATTVAPKVFQETAANGAVSGGVEIAATITGDSVKWQCYRYRVFETIVPIRNSAWRPTAWPT
jgi:type IV pilus assembly protein PilW